MSAGEMPDIVGALVSFTRSLDIPLPAGSATPTLPDANVTDELAKINASAFGIAFELIGFLSTADPMFPTARVDIRFVAPYKAGTAILWERFHGLVEPWPDPTRSFKANNTYVRFMMLNAGPMPVPDPNRDRIDLWTVYHVNFYRLRVP